MKNPHGVKPTRYMKRSSYNYAINCDPNYGPLFGNCDICIRNKCNINYDTIFNDGSFSYECHPEYKRSLFVNTAEPYETNYFFVLDYEVFVQS